MKPIKHKTNTHNVGTGANALQYTKTEVDQNGKPMTAMISFWKPTPDELMALNMGGCVSLMIVGQQMPTVAIAAIKE